MHTLLLVDDDPDVLATLTRSFRKGYKTFSANGGEEGIAFLNMHPVDLIICDQRMPNISGDQVDNATAEHMSLMSMLHDIGKLATPDAILKKPDKLTAEEWDIMREHPLAGVRILGNNPFYETAREISAGHHENYDGSGYPNGIKGEDIPLSARIVKLADVFDALTTQRPYKKPWPMEEALTHIEAHSGVMFDPAMVEALKMLFGDGTLMRIKSAF